MGAILRQRTRSFKISFQALISRESLPREDVKRRDTSREREREGGREGEQRDKNSGEHLNRERDACTTMKNGGRGGKKIQKMRRFARDR